MILVLDLPAQPTFSRPDCLSGSLPQYFRRSGVAVLVANLSGASRSRPAGHRLGQRAAPGVLGPLPRAGNVLFDLLPGNWQGSPLAKPVKSSGSSMWGETLLELGIKLTARL